MYASHVASPNSILFGLVVMAKILVVDDSYFMRIALRGILKSENHSVIEAEDGDQAVEIYRREEPDLVTMDITMPNKDGIEAAHEILAEYPSAKIVMVSALDQETLVKKVLQAGVSEFLVKPFKPEQVLGVVDRLLE